MKKLLLIDASNLLFRSYYATAYTGNLMQTKDGLYTNGIFGFAHAMTTLLNDGYTHVLVALDPKGKTHRHEVFADYKGTRQETPQELIMQFPLMQEYLEALGVYYYQKERYEADDIIGYAVKNFKDNFDAITIYSNDHDLMQLLDHHVNQLVSRKGLKEVELFTPAYLKEKMGVTPEQIADYKSLVGDSSDNIPGVPGVGPKTAVKLLEQYQNLEQLLKHTNELKGKLKERIEENQETAILSKQLATIVTDFDNDIDIDQAKYQGFEQEKLLAFYQKVGFYSFIKNMNVKKQPVLKDYVMIDHPDKIRVIIEKHAYLHLETFGQNYHVAKPLGFGVIFSEVPYFIPFDVALESEAFKQFLASEEHKKSVFDLKALKVALLWQDIEIKGIEFDLLLAAYLKSSAVNQDDFRDVVELYDYHDVFFDEQVYGKGAKYHLPKPSVYIPHVISKTKALKALKTEAMEDLAANDQVKLLTDIEMPLASVLADMEYQGICVNESALHDFGEELLEKMSETETLIYDLAGESFNINSPKQMGTILFEKLGLPVHKKTKTGYSTDISVLKKLTPFHPIISAIIDYRSYSKLHSTYYEGLKQALTIKNDGKIHTIYQQALTKTGRLSSREPNLQNIPIRNEEGRLLRKIFVPSLDRLLVSFDYSQIELRVLAELGDVKALKKAFIEGLDIHEETARQIFRKTDISTSERGIAKAINFSIIYGKTPWGLSEDLNISLTKAKEFIKSYNEHYPEIETLTGKNIAFAKEHGYVTTKFNRIIHIDEIKSKNYQTREFGKRIAMNAPIQGTAADILKIAMVKIYQAFKTAKVTSKMILQIHDEIVLDVPKDELEKVMTIVKEQMEHAVDFETILVANGSYGENLYEVK